MSQTEVVDMASATDTGDDESTSPSSSPSQTMTGSLAGSLTSAPSVLPASLSSNVSASQSGSSSNSVSATVSRVSVSFIPANAAPGGLLFTQPPATVTSFYKIAPSQLITFGWNFTSLSVTPTKLTFSAVCENGNTYPVGPTDGIISLNGTGGGQNSTGNANGTDVNRGGSVVREVVWDVNSYQVANPDKPLAQAKYTLHVWDERGPNAARRGGYFEHNSAVQFALYTPQPYIPLASGWTCAACSSGASTYATHPATISLTITLFITFLSGLHLIRTMRGSQMRI